MSRGQLYESSPASVTNRPRDLRIDPATVAQLRPRRESKAWVAWVLLGMMAGASLAGIAYELKERYRGADVRMSPTHSANTTEGPR